MSASGSKVLFLSLPGESESFGKELARGLPESGVTHEFLDVAPDSYNAILDRLEAGVIPVILKSRRQERA